VLRRKKKKALNESGKKRQKLLVNLVGKTDVQKHFGNVDAHGCAQLQLLQDQ
jgi:hypothetical protein